MARIRRDGPPHGPRDPRSNGRRAALARALVWIALAAASAACASAPANQISVGHEGAPGVRRVLLCPPNLVLALRAKLQRGAQAIDREIEVYLANQGREVGRLGFGEAREHWAQAVAEARVTGSLSAATGIFVSRLAQDHAFDVVVMPSLILRQAQVDAGNASWDGVSRRMRMLNAPSKGISREDSTLAKGIAYGGYSGPAWVTSVHVIVLDRDGQQVFEGRGGIDFMQEIDLIDAGRSRRWELRPNKAIFLEHRFMYDGVVQAFAPYLAPPGE